jgi:hypothetical protein
MFTAHIWSPTNFVHRVIEPGIPTGAGFLSIEDVPRLQRVASGLAGLVHAHRRLWSRKSLTLNLSPANCVEKIVLRFKGLVINVYPLTMVRR